MNAKAKNNTAVQNDVAVNKKATSISAMNRTNKDQVSRTDRYKADPRLLFLEPGFNMRIMGTQESRDHVDSIKESLRAYIQKDDPENKTLDVKKHDLLDVIPEIKAVVTEDGRLKVFEGGHRTVAIHELLAEGFDLGLVPVDAHQIDGVDVRYAMLRSSLGMEHTPLERAIEYANLVDNFGQTITQIAAQSGKTTVQRVEQLLILGRAHKDVHQLVLEKKITADGAIEILRKHRDNADEGLKEIQALVESKGASKAPVGRALTRRSISKASQDKLFSAVSESAPKLSQTLSDVKAKHGDNWEDKTVSVQLPAAVVAEILERMGKQAQGAEAALEAA